MALDRGKTLGQVFTPKWIADLIVCWSIRSKDDKVLDPGAGTGIFIEAALRRLHLLGSQNPGAQIVAIELDNTLTNTLFTKYGNLGVRIITGDFFLYRSSPLLYTQLNGQTLPLFDAIVGNPPYVERQLIPNYEYLKKIYPNVPSLADTYVYFIVHSSTFLKTGGRIGFIVSDSWLTANYGRFLKKFLLGEIGLKYIIYFDKRVFLNRLVSSTIILAEKTQQKPSELTFIRVKDTDERTVKMLKSIVCNYNKVCLTELQNKGNDLIVTKTPTNLISVHEQWLPYALGLKYYLKLKSHTMLVPLHKIARVSIGLFTLANNFYIIDDEKKFRFNIEDEFLKKILVSPKEIAKSIINGSNVTRYVLYCNRPKESLKSTNVLNYIEWGENQLVKIRGKNVVVKGYHNIPRIKMSKRDPWYNLVPEINGRCIKPIVFPRRIYDRFVVAWNKDNIVVSDNFLVIEAMKEEQTLPLLATLNSSISEYFARSMAHLYGGGVCDHTPNTVKRIPVLDITKMSNEELEALSKAFLKYANTLNRKVIDELVINILNLSKNDYERIIEELNEIKRVQKGR